MNSRNPKLKEALLLNRTRLGFIKWIAGFPILLLTVLLFIFAPNSQGADVSVTAALSQTTASVGEAVDLEIIISGARGGRVPQEIVIDGLSINYTGESTNVQMNNFNITMTVTHTFSVLPQRAGTFTIPGQTVEVDGKPFTTQPVTLTVAAAIGGTQGGGAAGSQGGGTGGGTDSQLAYAELVVPKSKAYVGEIIPVELRIYVDSRIRWQLRELPTITGEGFTTQKLTEPLRNQIQRGNATYDLITFKTAITPVKMGHLGIGPVDIQCVAQIPQRRKRPRFATDDFDSLFNDPFGMFAPAQNVTIHIDRNELDVRSLPPNAPKSFAGAVGTFTLSSKASPSKVNVGDPITLSLAINGRGNFDRVNSPKLMDESGWHTYPASSKFKADDDIGISGVKTFDMAIIPEQAQTKLPVVEFSYFDPLAEKYVTLQAERDPVTVLGNSTTTATPTPAIASSANTPSNGSTPTPSTSPSPAPAPSDISYILTGPTKWGRSFEPIFLSKSFWQAQALPLLALLAFIGFQLSQARKADEKGQRLAELRAQKGQLLERLKNESIDARSFYDAAMQIVQLEVASATGARTPSSIGADEACSFKNTDALLRTQIREIFDHCNQFRYAGGSTTTSPVPKEERAQVLQTLKAFQSNKESNQPEKNHAIS